MMIDRDAWLAAVKAASNQPLPESNAITVAELSELLGVAETTARRRARDLVAAGKATQTTKLCRRGNAVVKVPAYELMTPEVSDARARDAGRLRRDRSRA